MCFNFFLTSGTQPVFVFTLWNNITLVVEYIILKTFFFQMEACRADRNWAERNNLQYPIFSHFCHLSIPPFQKILKTSSKGFLAFKCDVGNWIFSKLRIFSEFFMRIFLDFLGGFFKEGFLRRNSLVTLWYERNGFWFLSRFCLKAGGQEFRSLDVQGWLIALRNYLCLAT